MDTETTPQANPAGEAARAERYAVMTDEKHPLHAAFRRGDSDAVEKHLDPFYEKAYGKPAAGSFDLAQGVTADQDGVRAGIGARLDAPLTPEERDTSEAEGLSGEDAAAWAPALNQLEGEWGREFPARMATAKAGLEALDAKLGKDLSEDLIGAYIEAGGDRVTLYKIAEQLGRT